MSYSGKVKPGGPAAVRELHGAFQAGLIPDPMTDPRYSNIKLMQKAELR